MPRTPTPTVELSGPQKAALMLVHLGRENSARVLRVMDEAEVEMIMSEVARLDEVHAVVMQQVMEEFEAAASARASSAQGGMDFVKEVLEEGLGRDRARLMMRRIDGKVQPFEFLKSVDHRQLVVYLSDEHPQTVALIVSHLDAAQAAPLLADLPPDLAGEVAHRIVVMEPPSPEVVSQVEATLRRKLPPRDPSLLPLATGGVQPLVEILNRSTPEIEAAILEQLDRANPVLADEIRRKLFGFENIVSLDDRSLQLVLREVQITTLAIAVKGVGAQVYDRVIANLSERAAETLREEIDLLGPVRRSQVDDARDAVVAVVRTLESAGQVVVARGEDSFVD